MKTIITFMLLHLAAVQTSGQQIAEDSTGKNQLSAFKSFMDEICDQGSDTLITSTDTLIKYKVVFSSEGNFADPKNFFMRICHVNNIKTENQLVEVHHLISVADSLKSYFRSNSCEQIRTCLLNTRWGDPLPDTMINIQSEPSFWATGVTAREIIFSNAVPLPEGFGQETVYKKTVSPTIISYKNGQYLIADIIIMFTYIGNQTDYGSSRTYYLERIE